MPLWRRGKPLHERLAEKGGLVPRGHEPYDTTPRWGEVGIHGVARPRRWDAVGSAPAPRLPGDAVHFVALEDGSLLVEEDVPDDSLTPLAEAVEATVAPPYRAEAVRRDGEVWAVAATRIEIVELPDDVAGDEVDLAVQGGDRTLVVDGEQSFGSVPELERVAARRGFDAYVVHAERLDGPLWEVRVAPL